MGALDQATTLFRPRAGSWPRPRCVSSATCHKDVPLSGDTCTPALYPVLVLQRGFPGHATPATGRRHERGNDSLLQVIFRQHTTRTSSVSLGSPFPRGFYCPATPPPPRIPYTGTPDYKAEIMTPYWHFPPAYSSLEPLTGPGRRRYRHGPRWPQQVNRATMFATGIAASPKRKGK